MTTARAIGLLLGGKAVLAEDILDDGDLARVLRRGLPASVHRHLETCGTLSADELARLLGVERRMDGEPSRLSPVASEILVRVLRVMVIASDRLGSPAMAHAWLRRSNHALGDRAPLDLLDTPEGAACVEARLHALDGG